MLKELAQIKKELDAITELLKNGVIKKEDAVKALEKISSKI